MQKIYAFIIIISSMMLIVFGAIINSSTYFDEYSGVYEVYLSSNSSKAKIVSVDKRKASSIVCKTGEAIFIENSELDAYEIFDDFQAKLIFVEKTDEGISYYGYSQEIKFQKRINGKDINIQVFQGNKGIKIGLPIIYGSF